MAAKKDEILKVVMNLKGTRRLNVLYINIYLLYTVIMYNIVYLFINY